METRRLLAAMAAMMAVFFVWMFLVRTFAPQALEPRQPAPTPTTAPATQPATPARAASAEPPAEPTPEAPGRPAAGPAARYRARGSTSPEPQTLYLGSTEGGRQSPYRMEIEFTSRGAAVSRIRLSDYSQTVDRHEPYLLLHPVHLVGGEDASAFATAGVTLTVADQPVYVDLRRCVWRARREETETGQRAVFEADILRDDTLLATVVKEYFLPRQSAEEGRYDLFISVTVRNAGDEPLACAVTQWGPAGLARDIDRFENRHLYVALRQADRLSIQKINPAEVAKSGRLDLPPPTPDLQPQWLAMDNKYFMSLVAPPYDQGLTFDERIARIQALHLDTGNGRRDPESITFALTTARQTLAPGESFERRLAAYIGPKSRTVLARVPDYAARDYGRVVTAGYSACTFVWLTNLMIFLLNLFYKFIGNYGVAIIILVLLVRLLLHPITKTSQVNMVKMQEQMSVLQPRLEEIRKKYANDKKRQQEEMMAAYREAGVSPASQLLTCLPMLLQMPIWVALWSALSYTIEMRHQPFVLWIRDLTSPDAINEWLGWHFAPFHFPLLSSMIGPITSFNLLPILMAVSMYLQQRYMPRAATEARMKQRSEDQLAQQRMIMNFMTVFFAVLFYNAPSGLNLYIMASSAFGALEQWRIRQHIRAEKERPATPTPPRRPRRKGMLDDLFKAADEAKRVRSARASRRRR